MVRGWGMIRMFDCKALILLAALSLAAPAAFGQGGVDEAQLCVNQCLFNHGPVSNPAYHACVAQMCEAPGDDAPTQPQQAPARAAWQNETIPGGGAHAASVTVDRRTLSYLCQRGGPGLLGIAGLGNTANGVGLTIDGRDFRMPFIAQNGVLYTAADRGSPLLASLMAGSSVQVANGQGQRASFPLNGSGSAIRRAMQGCGLQP